MLPKFFIAFALALTLPFFVSAQETSVSPLRFIPPTSPFQTADTNTPVGIKSCTPQTPASADGTLSLKQGEPVSFSCVLSNTGTTTLLAILSGQVTGGEVLTSVSSSIELKKGEATVPVKIPTPFGNGTLTFVISLVDKAGKSFGKRLEYTGILNTGIAEITSAKISAGPYISGETAMLTFMISPDPTKLTKDKELTLGMVAEDSNGKSCASFILPDVSSSENINNFIVPTNKNDCVVSALKITIRSKGGFLEDQKKIPFTVGEKRSGVNNLWMNIMLLVAGLIGVLLVRTLLIQYRIKKTTP